MLHTSFGLNIRRRGVNLPMVDMKDGNSPVRRVKPNRRSNTGYYNSLKGGNVEFESQLERDAYLLLDFEPLVKTLKVQPLRIENYVPDCLVETSEQLQLLADVKYEAELVEEWDELYSKFEKARKYSKENEIEFGFITDSIVYGKENRLDILKFIKYMGRGKSNNEIQSQLLNVVSHRDRITIKSLAEELREFKTGSVIREVCRLVCSGIASVLETPNVNLMDCVLTFSDRTTKNRQGCPDDFFIGFERFLKRLKTHPTPYFQNGGTARLVS